MVRIPSSLAECKARAPECRALVNDMKRQLGDSYKITYDTRNTEIPVTGHDLYLVGHTGRGGGTKVVDVCADGILDFFLNTLAEKGTMWELEYDGVLWIFM